MGMMPNMGNPFSERANPFMGLAALPQFEKMLPAESLLKMPPREMVTSENLEPKPEMNNLEKFPLMSKEMFLPSFNREPQMRMMPPMGLDSLPKMPRFRLPSFM